MHHPYPTWPGQGFVFWPEPIAIAFSGCICGGTCAHLSAGIEIPAAGFVDLYCRSCADYGVVDYSEQPFAELAQNYQVHANRIV
jgi:hypothetical protein